MEVRRMLDSELALVPKLERGEVEPKLLEITGRPVVRGKFLFVGNEKFWIKGVTYGTFHPDSEGNEYGTIEKVESDFRFMAESGINCIRTYTVPPTWVLDAAQRTGLRVMVGLPWEQHVTFLDDPERAERIENQIRKYVHQCKAHPAVLCYAVGNEIPASIVRWHGRKRIEQFIYRLYRAVKEIDPDALVTYVNFPPTEYLHLPFLDLVSFNVYLESQETFRAYLDRLNNLTEGRPLLMAEIGLDSRRNGVWKQASVLDWQVRATFEAGCAGGFVFSWTDEWYRGGHEIDDWQFGLTSKDRIPKPALKSVKTAFNETIFSPVRDWPMISVVVCTFNGKATIRDTLNGLQELDYPYYEVIVVNDGSTDGTEKIAAEYGVKIITTENCGLSSARNTGFRAASGSIIAYIDDDAYPDRDWLTFLAIAFLDYDYAAVGGPNLPPPDDGLISTCVAHAPGGPNHVLFTDTEAEHIPGCNMAFRKEVLESIGGFDPVFRTAGDDVDVCWRVQQSDGVIGFSHAAIVWHHRRGSLKAYWRQQKGYGRAEGMLEAKWPDKYNNLGHVAWGGRIYGNGSTLQLGTIRNRIYQGVWGSAPFQRLYEISGGGIWTLSSMPEWYFMIAAFAALSLAGLTWRPLLYSIPLLMISIAIPVTRALLSAMRAGFAGAPKGPWLHIKRVAITAFLHLQQPLARLCGRLTYGLTPWRNRTNGKSFEPIPNKVSIWQERWRDPNETLRKLLNFLRESGAPVLCGGEFDTWDLEVSGGLFGKSRLRMAVEEHGNGKQMLRFRLWTSHTAFGITLIAMALILTALTAADGVWIVATIFCSFFTIFWLRAVFECLQSKHLFFQAIQEWRKIILSNENRSDF
jgi:O-antigen biosynthesis protein